MAFRAGTAALVGRPNVGKSTLLNRLVGEKVSIVSDRPQTTRNRISGVVNRPGAQVVLVDTPGIHKPLHRMNERMLRASLSALDGVDVVCALTDVTEEMGGGDRFLLKTLERARAPVFLLLNKIDLVTVKARLLPLIERWAQGFPFAEVYPIAGATGEGTEALLDGIEARLPESEPLFAADEYTDVTMRFLASEIVREKVILATRDEVPYTTGVLVESFEEPAAGEEGGLVRIEATVVVERDSQKGIVVGKGGAVIKKIGTDARVEIEQILGRRVFLGLRVKAAPRWREDERILDRLGLGR